MHGSQEVCYDLSSAAVISTAWRTCALCVLLPLLPLLDGSIAATKMYLESPEGQT